MLSKNQVLKSIEKEINIIKNISKKLNPSMMEYKPKEGFRTTQELLSYIQNCGYGMLDFWMKSDVSMKDHFAKLREETPMIDLNNFEQRMDLQKANIQNAFAHIQDEEWQTKMVTYPWGVSAPIGEAIMETTLKWLCAYKYQLFMYVKLGSDELLTTPDVWVKE